MNGIIVKLENVNGKQVPAVTRNSWPRCLGRSTTMCFVISGKP